MRCARRTSPDSLRNLLQLQQDLFVAGAELATAPEAADRLEDGVSRVTDGMVDAVEVDIDRYMRQVDLPPQFVIPGGTELSAALDVARSAIRRAERRIVALRDADGLASEAVLRYVNRASDLAFAMARFADEPNPQLFEGQEGVRGCVAHSHAGARASRPRSRSASHRLIVRQHRGRRRRRRRPQADRAAGRGARLVHRR